jgi:tRNA threonylcarbamoyl adenosine modification protein YeaZ
MKILAIEFSSERRSVAVCSGGAVHGRAEETGGRTARALSLVERALNEAKLEREDIECIAVGLGPGSYAGIRSAISLAQGWQVARDVRVLGMNTADCLAAQAQASKRLGLVNIVIDAQRNEFYFASYELASDARRVVEPLRLLAYEESSARCAQGTTLVWPDLLSRFPDSHALLPDAATLGLLAATHADFTSGNQLEPIYLRETSFAKAPPARVVRGL